MNYKLLVWVVVLSLPNLSMVHQQRFGLLTDDYGLVTSEDLDEEERDNQCYPFEPVYSQMETPDDNCHNYWQCLSTSEVFMECEDGGDNGDFTHVGSANFWVRDKNITHHYVTRRNFSLETCHKWMAEWKEVIRGEEAVCFSGYFLSKSDHPEEGTSDPQGTQYYWIIDRMKSKHAEWSYFARKVENSSVRNDATDELLY